MVMQPVDITAVYVGVLGYVLFRLLFQCSAIRTLRPPKKVVDEEEEKVTSPAVGPDSKPQAINSVLPSVGSIQLAVIVVAGTLAKGVPIPPQPLIAGGLLYILYCFHHLHISSPLRSTEDMSQDTSTNQCSQKSQQDGCPAADAGAEKKPRAQPQYSVLPSTFFIQLAVLVVAGTRAREIGIPSQPLLASAIVYIYYRCVLYWLAPLAQTPGKAGKPAEPAVSRKEECSRQPRSPAAEAASDPIAPAVPADKWPKVSHSVLPSLLSTQLAVLVAAGAAAVHLEMPREPMMACAATYGYYRFVFHQFAPLKQSEKKQN
mmetsp:Transcript_8379/g.23545  ORF Transcript_8379/g.23545 Transcript_8379/m.23545 type:complete len:317 (-) Transcript_8379:94-1044(-)